MVGMQSDYDDCNTNDVFGRANSTRRSTSTAVSMSDQSVFMEEQHRIMAQHEALLKVKANTGFDIAEYNRQKEEELNHGRSNNQNKNYLYGKPPKRRVPARSPNLLDSNNSTELPKIEEPPLPNIRPKKSTHQKQLQKQLRSGGALHPGTIDNDIPLGNEEHYVKCVGCRSILRVTKAATLVGCPKCNAVSPARSIQKKVL